jgi:hypothetical protein
MIPIPDEVIASLAKDCDIVSKAILEAATGVPEKAIVRSFEDALLNLSFTS